MMTQQVNHTLSAEGVADIVDFSYIPFGNAYMTLPDSECQQGTGTMWDRPAAHCWMAQCNVSSTATQDCFTGDFRCQHGPDECTANTIEACVITQYPDFKNWYPFIQCFETAQGDPSSLNDCAKLSGINADQINSCAQGSEGAKASAQMAQKTVQLEPQHHFTPWIVVNDVAQSTAPPTDLLALVCQSYTGTPPPGCSESRNFHVPAVDRA